MTGQGKLLKIFCLAALFTGLASLVYGIVLAVGNFVDIDAWMTAGEGALASVYGARTAILANVPSNTSKISKKALALSVAGIAVVACFVAVETLSVTPIQLGLAVVVCVVGVVSALIARGIVKEQMRK